MKKIFMAGIISLSISACGGGGGGSQGSVAQINIQKQTPPSGFNLPNGEAINGSNVYINDHGSILTNLAVQHNEGVVQFSTPNIVLTSLVSVFLQQFGNIPLIVATSNIPGGAGIEANVTTDSIMTNVISDVQKNSTLWTPYFFNGVSSTSMPVGVASQNGFYIGTSANTDRGFLAFQNSSESSAPVTYLATKSACNTTISNSAISIAHTELSSGNLIAIGTNSGEILVYAITGKNSGKCQNLTKASKVLASYSPNSPIISLSFTSTGTNNYGYFVTQSGQIWRVVANANNVPQSFTQINGSIFSGAPITNISTIFSDSSNNVYVGTQDGFIYVLSPRDSLGNVNTTWSSATVGNNLPILSISSSINAIIAITQNSLYTVNLN